MQPLLGLHKLSPFVTWGNQESWQECVNNDISGLHPLPAAEVMIEQAPSSLGITLLVYECGKNLYINLDGREKD